ncbi:MAG: hypothetical protein IKQ53_06725 [Bacteroidales bacterium]|nr:hypothetical protein [Bacteroidales bacterium]
MEITQQQINAAYNVADDNQKRVLDALFGLQANQNGAIATKDNRPVTERIKTFEDARRELGDSNPLVFQYDELTHTNQEVEKMGSATDIVAYLKLRIIVAALNEGWEPKFEDGEYRWAPWFVLWTNKEMEEMSDEEKKEKGILPCRVVGRSSYYAHSNGGLAYTYAYCACSYSNTGVGSRLAFKSKELAEYAGKQFIEIHAQMMGLEVQK